MSVKLTLSLLLVVLAVTHAQNFLDFLNSDDINKPETRNEQPNRNCMCKGPACVCCVDFNITFLDQGRPEIVCGLCLSVRWTDDLKKVAEWEELKTVCGDVPWEKAISNSREIQIDVCVHMKYVSPEEGFAVNVSHGKNILHSAKIQGSNPAPICLSILGKFVQMCAKFSDLAPTADGLRGCIELEPKLFGDTQLEFPVGCFKSSEGGMEMEDPPAKPVETPEEENNTEDNNGFDAETFLLGVYQTAEQGVAFLSSLLDLPNRVNSTSAVANVTSTAKPEETSSAETSQRRAPKNLKHPNQL